MADSHVLFALRRRYGELLGRDGSSENLAHVGAVLRMFNAAEDVASIQPIRRYVNRRGAHGALWTRTAVRVLRQANEPMTAHEIAVRVLAVLERPYDRATVRNVQASLLNTLKLKQGVVKLPGRPMRWTLEKTHVTGH
ncbi:MAG: hypothetical protein Q7T19_08295 [Caulobacter sp.]|nr:hypothetical protein [Caulobacter sp.]